MTNKNLGEYTNIIGSAYRLELEKSPHKRLEKAAQLAETVSGALWNNSHTVTGEAGVPNWKEATRQLVESKSLNPIRAWMLAEVVATGVVSAHELTNVQPISDERLQHLAQSLAEGALTLTDSCYKVSKCYLGRN